MLICKQHGSIQCIPVGTWGTAPSISAMDGELLSCLLLLTWLNPSNLLRTWETYLSFGYVGTKDPQQK